MTRARFLYSKTALTGTLLALTMLALTASLSQSLAAASNNDERLYQIELVVFENKGNKVSSEIWTDDPGIPVLDGGIVLQHPQPANAADNQSMIETEIGKDNTDTTAIADETMVTVLPLDPKETDEQTQEPTTIEPYTLLPNDLLSLKSDVERLYNSREFQPLLHIGWQQYVPERDSPEKIQLDSQELLLYTTRLHEEDETQQDATTSDDLIADNDNNISMAPLYTQGPEEIVTEINQNFITGTLTLSRGRYLHLGLDLLYQRQSSTPQLFTFFGFGNTSETPEKYRLQQKRRMKRDEINYFDHPKFGVLALITAVEKSEADDKAVQTIPLRSLN